MRKEGEKMKLYLISQNENDDYDTYDSAVVVAYNVADARRIHPSGEENRTSEDWTSFENVHVEYLGEAVPELERGVVCASFNAG